MSPLFGTKYDDEKISRLVDKAIENTPAVNAINLQPIVRDGVIRMEGHVTNSMAKRHILESIEHTLRTAHVEYKSIEDNLAVGR